MCCKMVLRSFKEGLRMKRKVASIVACLLLLVCCYAEDAEIEIKPWYENGLGQYVPDPTAVIDGELNISKYSFIYVV